MTTAPQTAPDPKRARILDGAMKVFLAYGYSRVTMDDIARAAEMSRPALYLLFKNKAEIYRAIGAMLLDASADRRARGAGRRRAVRRAHDGGDRVLADRHDEDASRIRRTAPRSST